MDLIPEQILGNAYDHRESVVCENSVIANKAYVAACKKLMQINDWGKTENNILLTDFCLCDSEGSEVHRDPQINDYIKINLVGPGSKSGDGFDWVKIEQLINQEEEDDAAFCSIKVRPAVCPLNDSTGIAHFFDDAATSTFIVSKLKNEVIAEIHGRNEAPNTNTTYAADNVRNTLVAKLAAVKFSDVQWKNLCKSFIS